ncbi:MAG: hypothetical protein KTR30_05515 [Saprospiraceae bacterium]|nr:hypothetical protein [Saprospiraceae bacterium]
MKIAAAQMQSMPILMSNYLGDLWGIKAGGKSAFGDRNGDKIAPVYADEAGLLLLERNKGAWIAQIVDQKTGKQPQITSRDG